MIKRSIIPWILVAAFLMSTTAFGIVENIPNDPLLTLQKEPAKANMDVRNMRQLINTNLKQHIEYTRVAEGLADVLYNTSSTKKIKLMVKHDDFKYVYNLKSQALYVPFPLQMGNGSYNLDIYENTTGNKYKRTFFSQTTLTLENPNIVFLTSMQQITWTNDDAAIDKANELINAYKRSEFPDLLLEDVILSDREIIDILYNYVVKNITYDYNKIETLNYDYIPDIDEILEAKSGICYDYSVLLGAMLRSQGIPAKLIKGYSSFTDVYHAWNEIYLSDEERWAVVDTTYDSYMYLKKRPYDFEKSRMDYSTSYEY